MAGLALNGYAGLPSPPWEGPLPLEERPAATVAGQRRGQQYPLPEELSAILACQCSGPGHNVAHLCSVTHVPAERQGKRLPPSFPHRQQNSLSYKPRRPSLPLHSLLRTEAEVSAEECPWERAEAGPSLEGQFFCPLVLRPTMS